MKTLPNACGDKWQWYRTLKMASTTLQPSFWSFSVPVACSLKEWKCGDQWIWSSSYHFPQHCPMTHTYSWFALEKQHNPWGLQSFNFMVTNIPVGNYGKLSVTRTIRASFQKVRPGFLCWHNSFSLKELFCLYSSFKTIHIQDIFWKSR